jgi:hypothetical protein
MVTATVKMLHDTVGEVRQWVGTLVVAAAVCCVDEERDHSHWKGRVVEEIGENLDVVFRSTEIRIADFP